MRKSSLQTAISKICRKTHKMSLIKKLKTSSKLPWDEEKKKMKKVRDGGNARRRRRKCRRRLEGEVVPEEKEKQQRQRLFQIPIITL